MISSDERSKIVEYIKDHQKPNSPPISGRTGGGGGCGDFVLSAIECATQKNVVNADSIFSSGRDMRDIPGVMIISNYNDLSNLLPGDILCIIHGDSGFMRHYTLFFENHLEYGCLVAGTSNGFIDYSKLNRNTPGGANFILTKIYDFDFDGFGNFIYDNNDRINFLPSHSQLIKIDYTLR